MGERTGECSLGSRALQDWRCPAGLLQAGISGLHNCVGRGVSIQQCLGPILGALVYALEVLCKPHLKSPVLRHDLRSKLDQSHDLLESIQCQTSPKCSCHCESCSGYRPLYRRMRNLPCHHEYSICSTVEKRFVTMYGAWNLFSDCTHSKCLNVFVHGT